MVKGIGLKAALVAAGVMSTLSPALAQKITCKFGALGNVDFPGTIGMQAMAVKPPALPEEATIAVVAPASPPQERSGIEQATQYFESRGHEVVFGPNHRKVHGYLAGNDEERAWLRARRDTL